MVEYLNDKTIRFSSDDHGRGLLYTSSDGDAFLWYPGQTSVSKGSWLDSSFQFSRVDYFRVCFDFPVRKMSSDGVSGFMRSECVMLDELKSSVVEVVSGDALRLSNGRSPCRMCLFDDKITLMVKKSSI